MTHDPAKMTAEEVVEWLQAKLEVVDRCGESLSQALTRTTYYGPSRGPITVEIVHRIIALLQDPRLKLRWGVVMYGDLTSAHFTNDAAKEIAEKNFNPFKIKVIDLDAERENGAG